MDRKRRPSVFRGDGSVTVGYQALVVAHNLMFGGRKEDQLVHRAWTQVLKLTIVYSRRRKSRNLTRSRIRGDADLSASHVRRLFFVPLPGFIQRTVTTHDAACKPPTKDVNKKDVGERILQK